MRLREERPQVAVSDDEYRRLLGLPAGYAMQGLVGERARAAREWYSRHGRPWIAAREVQSLRIAGESLHVDGVTLASKALAARLRRAAAEGAVVAGVGAGAEVGDEARRLWEEGKPDEYFFLEVYAAAVVEQLATALGARLCAWADARGRVVLPHYSPGYPGWELRDQQPLHALLTADSEPLPAPVEVLWSGQLRPRHSLLALFGLAPLSEAATSVAALVPCTACSYAPCDYRRAPYRPPDRDLALAAFSEPARRLWSDLAGASGGPTP